MEKYKKETTLNSLEEELWGLNFLLKESLVKTYLHHLTHTCK